MCPPRTPGTPMVRFSPTGRAKGALGAPTPRPRGDPAGPVRHTYNTHLDGPGAHPRPGAPLEPCPPALGTTAPRPPRPHTPQGHRYTRVQGAARAGCTTSQNRSKSMPVGTARVKKILRESWRADFCCDFGSAHTWVNRCSSTHVAVRERVRPTPLHSAARSLGTWTVVHSAGEPWEAWPRVNYTTKVDLLSGGHATPACTLQVSMLRTLPDVGGGVVGSVLMLRKEIE